LDGLLALAVATIFAEHFPASVLPNELWVKASAVWTIVPVVFGVKVFVVHGWSMRK
jgi:hypothetical protein